MNYKRNILFILLSLSTISVKAHAKTYYTVSEALAYLYPKSEKIDFEKKSLSEEQVNKILLTINAKELPRNWTIYKATTKGQLDGYAIIDNIIGKESPITYIVSLSPMGVVNEVEILVYRESHGGQVKNKSYRQQFEGKTSKDTLMVGKDILHVSSATISSRQIALGVKRVLQVWQVFYGN